ncbi:MAG: DNA photolyase [Desulfobacteraceae bacterium]|nr:MAG: DNA photolyase [Desulfobacteraceae bacterium]
MKIKTLFIDYEVPRDEEVDFLIGSLKTPPQPVQDIREVYEHVNAGQDPILRAKHTLFITRNRGAVVKKCPGTSEYTCCDYTILHTGTFCSMDCSYCILQAYFHPPLMQYFSGLDQLTSHLNPYFKGNQVYRIGTGEFTDSLIWEPISLQPRFLVNLFARQDHCVLELKTKTVNIESLLELEHNQKTILAWSVNSPRIIQSQERGTASLKQRLEAAKKAEAAGYRLAFHFDPMVIYDGCITEYQDVVDQIFAHVDPKSIAWISMGTFRFMPHLKVIIENRFKSSDICYGEFILGLDNKMRYFKPLRMELYNQTVSYLKKRAPQVLVYFCMEDKQVWESSLGFFPSDENELGRLLDRSAAQHCGLDPSLLP